jgi:hypothetical protein
MLERPLFPGEQVAEQQAAAPLKHSEYLKQITEIALDIDKAQSVIRDQVAADRRLPQRESEQRENLAIFLGYFLSTTRRRGGDRTLDMPDRSKIDRKFKVDVYLTEKGGRTPCCAWSTPSWRCPRIRRCLLYGRESMNWQMEYPEFSSCGCRNTWKCCGAETN